MTGPILPMLLLAAAVSLCSRPRPPRTRLRSISRGPAARPGHRRWLAGSRARPASCAVAVGVLVAAAGGWPYGPLLAGPLSIAAWFVVRHRLRRGPRTPGPADQLGSAATWDLLAACLRAGLPVATAVRAVADGLSRPAASALRATADLLALGADPVDAWAPALDCTATAELARGARRTARSGTALAGVAAAVAAGIRHTVGDVAEARAQRAGVLVTGPLGLCFLPAFVCLGIVPVVVGLAAQLSVHQ